MKLIFKILLTFYRKISFLIIIVKFKNLFFLKFLNSGKDYHKKKIYGKTKTLENFFIHLFIYLFMFFYK
jgi:hypothetical protein